MLIKDLRDEYHQSLCKEIIRIKADKNNAQYPNFADSCNRSSVQIAMEVMKRLGHAEGHGTVTEQAAGNKFEALTREFLRRGFELLGHLRPGQWNYFVRKRISWFAQYEHLRHVESALKKDKELYSALGGDYIVKPDITISRAPVSDSEINKLGDLVSQNKDIAKLTHFRSANQQSDILHASISCKWTIRSDRSQNTRTEALNLIRRRKGNLPHVVAVTAEPLPTRIAALALGAGDLDCVYHFALPELISALRSLDNQDQMDILQTRVDGNRLRDISDLPFDLAV